MKIAHLTTVDLSLRYLILPQLKATRDLGWDTAGISSDGPWVSEIEADGIRHIPLASSTRGMNIFADLKSAGELWRILRAERFDILHTHNPKPGVYGRILGRLAGVPVVVNTVHGLYAAPDDPVTKRAIVYALEALASRFSDAELVQSNEDVSTMKRLRLASVSKITLLGNGVDLSRFKPGAVNDSGRRTLRDEFSVSDDDIVVGIVGRLVAEKGYPELFEASKQLGDGYVVVCIGPDDRDKSDALPSEMIRDAKESGVRFAGMRTDVDQLYGAMDIFVLPSHREGFPRSAMEAAGSGLPVVATDIRGCRDVVRDGVNGFLIPVKDPDAIAAAIRCLGDEPELRMSMGEAGREKATEEFDEDRVVRRVVSAYRRIARRKGLDIPGRIAIDDVTIRKATLDDAEVLARLHSSGIDTGFLPSLGHRFMSLIYRAMVTDPGAIVLVADDGDGPVGFVAGVADVGEFYRTFIRRYGLAASVAALPHAIRPSVMTKVWESLTYAGADSGGAELLATALLAGARGQGLGTALGVEFLRRMSDAGSRSIDVVVSADNHQAIASYRKMGFNDVATIEVHADERSLVLAWSV